MKKEYYFVALLFLTFFLNEAFAQRTCGTISGEAYYNSLTPETRDWLKSFNQMLELSEKNQSILNGTEGISTQSATSYISSNDIIFIPVVVHVVWNTNAENISEAQIFSQINVLNEDFNRLNADRTNTPSYFESRATATRIQFYLATIDPNGNPTNGITRTNTLTTQFTEANNNIKFTSSGGRNGWPPNRYLNIWVGPLRDQLLGYATLPEGLASNPNTDGVVIASTKST